MKRVPLLVAIASVAVIVVLFALWGGGVIAKHSAFSGMFAIVGVAQLVTAAWLARGRFERDTPLVQSVRGQALMGVAFLLAAGLLAPVWSLPAWVMVAGLIVFLAVFWLGVRLERRVRQQQRSAQVQHHG